LATAQSPMGRGKPYGLDPGVSKRVGR